VRAMLEGWVVQQRSRMLAGHTIDQRRQLVHRFLAFTNDYPWQWGPADVEEWTAELVGQGVWRTRRSVAIRWRWRCSAATSPIRVTAGSRPASTRCTSARKEQ
jgi:hypothetical protein